MRKRWVAAVGMAVLAAAAAITINPFEAKASQAGVKTHGNDYTYQSFGILEMQDDDGVTRIRIDAGDIYDLKDEIDSLRADFTAPVPEPPITVFSQPVTFSLHVTSERALQTMFFEPEEYGDEELEYGEYDDEEIEEEPSPTPGDELYDPDEGEPEIEPSPIPSETPEPEVSPTTEPTPLAAPTISPELDGEPLDGEE